MDLIFKALNNNEAFFLSRMTFPSYVELLKNVEDENTIAIQVVLNYKSIAMILCKEQKQNQWEILSVFTEKKYRNAGVATSLLSHTVEVLTSLDAKNIFVKYMTNKPNTAIINRLLDGAGFETMKKRQLDIQCSKMILQAPWIKTLYNPAKNFSIKLWHNLSKSEREDIKTSQQKNRWIPEYLVPFIYETGHEKQYSRALLYNDEVVGWSITHKLDSKTIRFTCSFIREDLQHYMQLMPLIIHTVEDIIKDGFEYGIWAVKVEERKMIAFSSRQMVSYSSWHGYSVSRTLTL